MLGWVDTNWLFRETDFPLLLAHIFTVTFVDGLTDDVIHTASVHRGDDVEMPAAPEHEGYTFTDWDKNGNRIMKDTVITAQYSINFYTVTYKDWDGKTLKKQTVAHGADATPPADPVREGYTFIGWDHDGKNITQNTIITAQYSIKTYTVQFVDWNGTVLKIEQVEHGKDATPPADPVREGYTFIGWDHDGKNITQDTTISALYVENFLMGDVNSDGKVNTGDAVMLLKHVAGTAKLNEQQLAVADFNGDNKVNTGDATAILLYIVKQHKKGAGSTFCAIAIKERFA